MIKFSCKNCGKKINAHQSHVGKKGRCPRCKTILVVPKIESTTPTESESSSNTYKLAPVLNIPPKNESVRPADDRNYDFEKTVEEAQDQQEIKEDQAEPVGKRKLPWLVDIFLYPISVPGLTILGIIIGVPLLFRIVVVLLSILTLRFPPSLVLLTLFAVVGFIVRIIIGLYMYWYLCECIRDSAAGGLRAPETMANTPGVGDMFWQMIKILCCFAFFAAPAFIYFRHTEEIDIIFWSLLAYGVFFFPMGLLAVIMFDSFTGLNPILLVGSIFSTFFQYCGLIILFGLLSILVIIPVSILSALPFLGFILAIVFIYLLMVTAHLLGRFYFRYQEKLYWEV